MSNLSLLLVSVLLFNLLFAVAAGIQVGNTVTSSYIVDSYPLQSTSVITFYAVFLNLSAFINPVCPYQNPPKKKNKKKN